MLRQLSDRADVHERLRHETQLAKAGRVPWQDTIAEVIDGLNHALPAQPKQARHQVLSAHRAAMSRYISSIPVGNASRLLSHLDSGLLTVADAYPRHIEPAPGGGWTIDWGDGRTEHIDWVVCATGFQPPALTTTPDGELRIGGPGAPGARSAQVSPDLRVVRDPGAARERMWVVGSAAGSRFPIVNYLRAAAQHARTVGQALATVPPARTPDGTPPDALAARSGPTNATAPSRIPERPAS